MLRAYGCRLYRLLTLTCSLCVLLRPGPAAGQDGSGQGVSAVPRRLPQAEAAAVPGGQRVRPDPPAAETELRHAQAAHQPAGLFRPAREQRGMYHMGNLKTLLHEIVAARCLYEQPAPSRASRARGLQHYLRPRASAVRGSAGGIVLGSCVVEFRGPDPPVRSFAEESRSPRRGGSGGSTNLA